ncbi:MAG: tetratricopeptide repeat protein [Ginsengibacter sp.]
MKKILFKLKPSFSSLVLMILVSCNGKNTGPSKELINEINLKRGEVISCGPADNQFGSVDFKITCNENAKKDFNLAIEMLHSFEYDESEKVFAKIIDETPECAMAYWGVAMCNFHPLWNPPTEAELQKGSKAIEIANSITKKSARESGYINAIAAFYKDWDKTDHHSRCVKFEKAMEKLYITYPEDKEAAIFYALALDGAAVPTDKNYTNQKKAASILNSIYPSEPNHPGIIHYLIHTYDYPGLAILALPAARHYAEVAPSSAHALHMPSHIFTRLGLWDECIASNLKSVSAANCYAESAGIKGHWDEELHGMDYLVYAYLQKGENNLALQQLKYLQTINEVYPANFKVAYAFAAIPSRYVLENKNWKEAAAVQMHPVNFPWNKFPWQEAIIHFTRLIGSVQIGNMEAANSELTKLNELHDTLEKQKDIYKSGQVAIQIKTGSAWIQFKSGKKIDGLNLMRLAADMEDSTEKHPVTPGEVLPARELLGDMLMQSRQNEKALQAYEEVLKKSPNRFNSLYGAGLAAEKSGNQQRAVFYFKQLVAIADTANSDRPELVATRAFLMKH